MSALGSNLNITNLKAIAKANEICNRYCIDTISAGMTIAFACECFENGIITTADTGGLELRFGDAPLIIRLLEMIAKREGFGDLLAEGMARLAQRWGVTDQPYYLAVKGQELPMHDPRVKVGVGLGYAISTYGADHMYAAHDTLFIDEQFYSFQQAKPLGISRPMHPTKITTEKVRNYFLLDTAWKMMDALGLCVFGYAPRGVVPVNLMVQCLNAITGWNSSLFELMKSAERSTMIARAFNCLEGFTIKDDRLPKRLFDPKPDGANAGQKIFTENDFQKAIEIFYEVIGCDPETGRPHRGKLIELGLEWVDELLNQRKKV
jgi:aldehyde:ferredoxin oxidoreductase